MAETKRTWSIPTSPRSPYKLPETLNLLTEFVGRVWDRENQILFAKRLAESDTYEGVVPQNLDFAARDRVNRAPTTFGFVELEPVVKITSAGKRLLANERIEELFTRQLLKWQYPSVKHHGDSYSNFNIKPFLEILRLAYEVDGLTKREIAIFCVPFIDYKKYDQVKDELVSYRAHLNSLRSNIERKRYILRRHSEYYRSIYKEEIESGIFTVRQRSGQVATADDFIETKVRNSKDYADAAIRYFRATGLFKLSATTFRLQVLDTKKQIVQEILSTNVRDPADFETDAEQFQSTLTNPDLPILPDDRPEVLQVEIKNLLAEAVAISPIPEAKASRYRSEKLVSASTHELKLKRDELEELIKNDTQQLQVRTLQSYELFDDIVSMYNKIVARADYDIPDKPLFFEWNTWRAFTMLNDGEIICNAKLDREGKPLSTAPGGGADSVCYYDDFALAVEVTLTRGERQFEAEYQSVPRHVGTLIKSLRDNRDGRSVYGIFIASGLNPSTIANFYALRRIAVTHYGGKVSIVPLELEDFKKMLEIAKGEGGIKSKNLLNFFKWADEQAEKAANEVTWHDVIRQQIPNWLSLPTS